MNIKSSVLNMLGLRWPRDVRVELSSRQMHASGTWKSCLEIGVGDSQSMQVVVKAQTWMRSLRGQYREESQEQRMQTVRSWRERKGPAGDADQSAQ